jgi:outer membrane protein assembly factor BamA
MAASMAMRAALGALALCAALLPVQARCDEQKAFIEISTGDFTEFCATNESCVSPTGEIYYNRVDGLLFYMGAQYRSDERLHPRLRAMWAWPSARADSYYRLDVEQPVHSQDSFSFGVSLYDRSAWSREDDEIISDFGNNMEAFWAREDDRDYFRREGATMFAQHRATPELTFRVEYRADKLSSLSTQQSVWTVFGRDDDWRDNPPLTLGVLASADTFDSWKRMRSYVWSVEYDAEDENRATGWSARGIFEFGGGSAGGDYDFRKHVLDARKHIPITDSQTLTLRGTLGISSGTDYPSHKLFHLGGRGDLRGYDYKEFGGKDLIFGQIEYLVRMNEDFDVIYFLESGSVDYGTDTPRSDDSGGHKQDAGIGFRYEAPWAGWIRLDFARAFEDDADVHVYLSLLLES